MPFSLSAPRVRWRRTLAAPLKSSCSRWLFSWFLLYLVVGNLPRFWHVAGFHDNFLVTEFVLFGGVLLYLLSFCRQLYGYMAWCAVIAIIVTSFGVGIFLFGFHPKPFLYAMRLIFMVMSGTLMGTLLYEYRQRTSFLKASGLLLRGYLALALLSLAILIFFPDSSTLWLWLNEYGAVFEGDPHQNRLISSYFDPNFYGAIATLPLLISGYAYFVTRQIRYIAYALFMIFSILLTGSRSATAALVLVLTLVGAHLLMHRLTAIVTRQRLLLFVTIALALVAFMVSQIELISHLIERFFIVSNDESALARLISFQFGWDLFMEHPLVGTGYNYLSILMKDLSDLSSVDSSLLALLINFGVIGMCAFAILFFLWSQQLYVSWRRVSPSDRAYRSFVAAYYIYLVVSITFTCNFNNLLFYQFWLIPTIALGVFLSLETNNRALEAQ